MKSKPDGGSSIWIDRLLLCAVRDTQTLDFWQLFCKLLYECSCLTCVSLPLYAGRIQNWLICIISSIILLGHVHVLLPWLQTIITKTRRRGKENYRPEYIHPCTWRRCWFSAACCTSINRPNEEKFESWCGMWTNPSNWQW